MTSEQGTQVTLLSVIFLALQLAQTALQEWIRRRKSEEQRGKLTQDVANEVHKRLVAKPESGQVDLSSTLKKEQIPE